MKKISFAETNCFFKPMVLAFIVLAFTAFGAAKAQTKHISLQEAIQMGIQNSKQLKISKAKIQEAETRFEQAKDRKLPQAKVTAMGSEAYIPAHTLQLSGMTNPLYLPNNSFLYLGTFSIDEPIFAGNKFKYAQESAKLLKQVASLNAEHDQKQIIIDVISAYINLYKLDQSRKIVQQNLEDVTNRLDETRKFEQQGLATKNDVLRFQLQQSNVNLTAIQLDNNRSVANFDTDLLLGMDENTKIETDSIVHQAKTLDSLSKFIDTALANRNDLATYPLQNKVADLHIKNLESDKLPTLGVGVSAYYINPNTQFIPPHNGYIIPTTIGLNLSWNISSLYTTKHKVDEAKVQKQETLIAQSATVDKIKSQVNTGYHNYLQAVDKISVLETAVKQAQENDRIMEAKFKNNLATTTDRLDAETMLYQSKINLVLARADAELAYYQLLESTGTIQ